jgi:putative ABC transport system ATP-binding protein
LPRQHGTAVVLVTHEPRFASWADRVVFLRDGRVVDETPAIAGTAR